MTAGRHSYVRFWPSDWLAGTGRMTRIHRSVYFEICCYNWDKNEPCPQTELALMLLDLENGSAVVAQLIGAGKLMQDERGVWSPRALEEAAYSYDQWEKRSRGGKAYKPSEHQPQRGKRKSVTKSVGTPIPTLIVSNNQNHTLPPKERKSLSGGDFVLPDWMPLDAWQGWLDMRKRSQHPVTQRAMALAITDLEKLKAKGHDPGKLLDLATLRSWRGIFPDDKGGTTLANGRQERLTL